MKNKVVCLFILFLLMNSLIVISQNIDEKNKVFTNYSNEISTNKTNPNLIFGDDVPNWNVSDYWTYKIDDIVVDFEGEGQKICLHLKIDELSLEVIEDTGESYNLSFNAKISGEYYAYIIQGYDVVELEGELKFITASGNIFFRKSDLGFEKIDAKISGILTCKILDQSYIDFPIPKIPILFPARISVIADFDVPFTFLDFPMDVNMTWGLPETNFSINGEFKSIWFNIVNFVNKIAGKFGIELLPPEYADLLPVVDIKAALEVLGIGNIFEIPEVPNVFFCKNIEELNICSEIITAYNISVAGGLGNIYYAPKIKNIVKISGTFADILPFVSDINAELIAYGSL